MIEPTVREVILYCENCQSEDKYFMTNKEIFDKTTTQSYCNNCKRTTKKQQTKKEQEVKKMKYDVKTTIEIVKEIMKLPLDKKTNTIKMVDVKKLIEKTIKKIPEKEAWKYLNLIEGKQLEKPNKALQKELKKSIKL